MNNLDTESTEDAEIRRGRFPNLPGTLPEQPSTETQVSPRSRGDGRGVYHVFFPLPSHDFPGCGPQQLVEDPTPAMIDFARQNPHLAHLIEV